MNNTTKKYATRNGLEVEIHIGRGLDEEHPVVGAYLDESGEWQMNDWTLEGEHIKGEQGELDLVVVSVSN